jgi:hypothetical protein
VLAAEVEDSGGTVTARESQLMEAQSLLDQVHREKDTAMQEVTLPETCFVSSFCFVLSYPLLYISD